MAVTNSEPARIRRKPRAAVARREAVELAIWLERKRPSEVRLQAKRRLARIWQKTIPKSILPKKLKEKAIGRAKSKPKVRKTRQLRNLLRTTSISVTG